MPVKKFLLKVFLILVLTISFDQVTKYYAFTYLFVENQIININQFLNLRPVWNDGISFGMLQGHGNKG